jgi:sacsin
VRKCIYNDATWLSADLNTYKKSHGLELLHSLIPIEDADKLGAQSYKSLLRASEDSEGLSCPSSGAITARLPLDEDPVSLFLECIEVADIVGAKKVHFMVDKREHESESLFLRSLAQFQGPAVIIYLDQVIQGDQLSALFTTNCGFNEKPIVYGQGLATLFHYADVVSVVSGSHLHIYDPSGVYLNENFQEKSPAASGAVGKVFDFLKNDRVRRFPDQFSPYSLFGFKKDAPLKGTLIRVPLRTPAQASTSGIKNKSYDIDTISSAFESFQEQASSSLLFLTQLESISFMSWEAQEKDYSAKFSTNVHSSPEVRSARTEMTKNKNSKWLDNGLLSGFWPFAKEISHSYSLKVASKDYVTGYDVTEEWFISSCVTNGTFSFFRKYYFRVAH